MGMGGNGNELSGAIREWEWFFKCVNFGNENGKDLVGMGEIGNTENHSRTSLVRTMLQSVWHPTCDKETCRVFIAVSVGGEFLPSLPCVTAP